MFRQTATQPQWLKPCGYAVMPSLGRSIDLTASRENHERGRWRS
jgi:hypothetical protein